MVAGSLDLCDHRNNFGQSLLVVTIGGGGGDDNK